MKNLHLYISLLFILTCAKEDSQDPNNAPSQITRQYTLSVSSGDGGSVSGGGTFLQGTEVSLTATASVGYSFSSWSNGSTNNPLTVTLNANTSISANFEALPNTYTLTVSAGEGGSVSSEGGAYEEGTQLTLTASPDDGYQFISWSNGSTEAFLNISVNDNIALQANFEILDVVMKTKTILIDTSVLPENVQSTFYNVSGVFTYKSNEDDFIFFPGNPNLNSGLNIYNQSELGYSKDHIPSIPSQILKNVNGFWEFFKTDYTANFWGARNFEVKDNYIVIGDGNELGSDASEWSGDTFFGEILNDGNINWTRVNDDLNMSFFHGSAIGDLNNDGLMDIGGAPAQPIKIFLQSTPNNFQNSDNLIESNETSPFTLNFVDVFGDERDEIISADYGHGNPSSDTDLNQIRIYSYNEDIEKFELHWKSNNSSAFYNLGLGATSIKVADFNNDGIKDISVAREDIEAGNAFEIWLGNGDGTFNPKYSSPLWNQDELQFREFYVMDVNLDGFEDIILRPFHYGSLYRNNPVWWNVGENNGIKFNHLIWINQGDGSFSYYNEKELKVEGINIDNVHPYMKNGKLHFVGTFTDNWNGNELITYDFMINL